MAAAVPVLQPASIQVSHLNQVALPVASAFGKAGLAVVFVSFFAATAECALSSGYSVAQYMGWSWGKRHPPGAAARFHLVCLVSVIAATAFTLTTVDPITVTIFAVVLGAAAVPLTYFPILIVANDARLMGERVNRRLCGATAFGPRLGGRLGTWWQAIGRRLRPVTESYPNRIATELIDHVDRLEITLLTRREHLDSYRFRQWTEEKVIGRIPGSTK
jgi:hypothetical protein